MPRRITKPPGKSEDTAAQNQHFSLTEPILKEKNICNENTIGKYFFH
ncbi:hypothetical protein [Salinibacillus kushneri]|nr:hypothetical protein [Salinibacillus kushneri]